MERNTLRESRGGHLAVRRGARDWPMTVVLGLALLFSGMPHEITAGEWTD